MTLEADYLEALGLLGRVCEQYRRETGSPAYLVGGAAVALWTGGAFHSADFDLIVASAISHLQRGYRPLARCLNQPCCGGRVAIHRRDYGPL
ncbi:hypothetical protein ACMV_P3_00020 (plasmid) [Acidiphilium multivorum AIU301]|uniref:Nucleotidyltransferase n=1 Tax=Acidiphilium multivorum (strain DSM 11245 / JCM 8867 / NBRC 100883 / AIU 301) TaxID=926570 RepID=F0J7T4_ACIMA|nr:hypothetical protein ACMV_P3_00020 [Acidiphilium multivorum AIU301]